MTTTELFETVLQLPVAIRRDLMLRIRESIRDHVAPDGLWYEDSPEFAAELERRIQDSIEHPEEMISGEDVIERLRQRLAENTLREKRRSGRRHGQ